MSPRDFLTPHAKRLLLTGAALVTAILAITGPIAAGASAVDQRYVKQRTYDSLQMVQRGRSSLDSLRHMHELEKIDGKLARIDSTLMRMERRGGR